MADNISPIKPNIEMAPVPESGTVSAPENKPEKTADFERPAAKIETETTSKPTTLPSSAPLPAAKASGVSLKDIEQVLSSDLEDIYFQLTPDKQQEFKLKGEETSRRVKTLLEQGKVKIKKIALIIFDWLKIIPGVNKFFLEKESKIKAEELIKLEVRSRK